MNEAMGIQIASERRMMLVAAELSIANVTAENVLFSFSLKSGEELRPALIVYLPNRKNKIFDLLDM